MPDTAKRDALVSEILAFLAGGDLLTLGDIRAALEREIDLAGPAALVALKERLTADAGWTYYPPDPLARRIHHVLADRVLQPESTLSGRDHVREVAHGPVVICGNHLSYADANALDVLLVRAGGSELADRLTAIAGPKVYTSRTRRFSSLCFGTIRVPQSTDVSSEEAVLSTREVARAARQSIEAARERLRAADALVLFGEGRRSRSRGMQPLLPGVARYLDVAGARILPVGIVGTEALYPIGDESVHPACITIRVGRSMDAEALCTLAHGDGRLIVDTIGVAIGELLPAEYRGVYANADMPDAHQLLAEVRHSV